MVKFTDIEDFRSMLESIYRFSQMDDLPEDLKVLYDFSEVKAIVNKDQLKAISEISLEAVDKYKSVKTALVVGSIIEAGYSAIFASLVQVPKVQRRVFSNTKDALSWLAASNEQVQ